MAVMLTLKIQFKILTTLLLLVGGDVPLKSSTSKSGNDIRDDMNDVGMLAYFNGDCPSGWREYKELSGRFPLASGAYIGKREDGAAETANYEIGSYGGEINHVLSAAQLPRHDHSNGEFKYMLKGDGRWTGGRMDNTPNEPNLVYKGHIQSVGENNAHNNMPPFLVLNACEKVQSSPGVSSLQSEIDELEKENVRLNARLATLERLIMLKKDL